MHTLLFLGEDDHGNSDELCSPSRKKARLLEMADSEPSTSRSGTDLEGRDAGLVLQNPQLHCPDKLPPAWSSLFYLTKVRGIAEQYNRSNMAMGIRGD